MSISSLGTKFIILSHHPRHSRIGGCASIFNVFFSPDREYDNVDYLNVKESSTEDFLAGLISKTDESSVLLFNGCYSLCSRHSVLALQYARENEINVRVYWHETSWHLSKAFSALSKIKDLLVGHHVHHWAASSQCKQLLMFFLGCCYEDVTVVYEAIPIPKEAVCRKIQLDHSEIRICGTGLDSEVRKGLDLFVDISATLTSIEHISCHYDWFGKGSEKQSKVLECVNFPGFSSDFRKTLNEYDIFLLTSRDDPFPLAALEALANDLPVFCLDAVGMLEILPRDFVAASTVEMAQNIQKFWKNRDKYPPGFFHSIAREFSTKYFIERIFRYEHVVKSPRYFDMVVPRWRLTYYGNTPPEGDILLLATIPHKLVCDVIQHELKGSLSAIFAREDFNFEVAGEIPLIHYPQGAITPLLSHDSEIEKSIIDVGADIYLVLFYDEFGRGYEDVIEFIQGFGVEKVWIRTLSGSYYSLSSLAY